MRAFETRQQHALEGADGDRDLCMTWDMQFPELGNTAEIVTKDMRVVVWLQHEGVLEDVSCSVSVPILESSCIRLHCHTAPERWH